MQSSISSTEDSIENSVPSVLLSNQYEEYCGILYRVGNVQTYAICHLASLFDARQRGF
jgi:hypothetical protein